MAVHPVKQPAKLVASGLWALAGRIYTAGVGIATMALLARALSTAEFGAYLLAASAVLFGSTVATFGLNVWIVRWVAESLANDDYGRLRRAIRVALAGCTAGAVLVGAAYLVLARTAVAEGFRGPELGPLASSVAAWIALQALVMLFAETFRGFHDIRLASILNGPLTQSTVVAAAIGLWLAGRISLESFVAAILVSLCLTILVGGVLLRARLAMLGHATAGRDNLATTHLTYRGALLESVPLMLNAMFALLMTQIDLWVVGASSPQWCSTLDVAVYGVVVRLMAIITMPLVVVNAVLLPEVASLWSRGMTHELQRLLRSAATLAGIPSAAALALVALGSGSVLELLFGPEYRHGAAILVVACCGQLIVTWCGTPGSALAMTGHSRAVMLVAASGFLVTFVGAVCVVPYFGIMGVAAASATSAAINRIIQVVLVRRYLDVWTHVDVQQLIPALRALPQRGLRIVGISRES